jgi:hypothetical protein
VLRSAVWCRVAALRVGAYSGPQVRIDSSAPHAAREMMFGIVAPELAPAWSTAPDSAGTRSARLSPGSISATETSSGTTPPAPCTMTSTP